VKPAASRDPNPERSDGPWQPVLLYPRPLAAARGRDAMATVPPTPCGL